MSRLRRGGLRYRARRPPDGSDARVVVVGIGFAGLATVQAAGAGRACGHAGGPQRLQHLPAAALPGRDGGPEPGDVVLPAAGVRPQVRRPVPARRARGIDRRRPAVTLADGEPARLRLSRPRHRGVRGVLRRHRGGQAQLRPVHPPRRGRAARPDPVRSGAAQRHGPRAWSGRSRWWAAAPPAWRLAGTLAELRNIALPTRIPRSTAAACTDQAGRAESPRLLAPYHPVAARVRPPAAARPRCRRPAGHHDP